MVSDVHLQWTKAGTPPKRLNLCTTHDTLALSQDQVGA